MSQYPPLDPRTELGIDPHRLPAHVAIIMDGNGRWAEARGLPRILGHQAGAISVREIVTCAARLGIRHLTLFSFSMENWKRPADEVSALMELYAQYLIEERPVILQGNIRFRQIGRRDGLPESVLREMDVTQRLSEGNNGMTLMLALNYGSRTEIVDAVRKIAARVKAGELGVDEITDATVSESLYTAGIPDPDLLVRTSGERRISNFLLWQISYAELHVTDVHWPEFRTQHLYAAIRDFASRDRRFGAIAPSAATRPHP